MHIEHEPVAEELFEIIAQALEGEGYLVLPTTPGGSGLRAFLIGEYRARPGAEPQPSVAPRQNSLDS
jgi:hypothetical protein